MPTSFPSLRGILQSSAAQYASFLLGQGKSAASVIVDVAGRFLGLSSAQVGEAERAAEDMRSAGRRYQRLAANRAVTDRFVPVNPVLPHQYRYTATVQFSVQGHAQSEYRTVAIDSSERLTHGAITSLAISQAATYFNVGGSPKAPSEPVVASVVGATVDSAQRRS